MLETSYQKIKKYVCETETDGVLVTRNDSFLGEYYPPEAGRLEQVTGFTGSAGLALITKEKDILFVDSRYTLQAKTQSKFTVFEVPTETTPSAWIKTNLPEGRIAFNPETHSVTWFLKMSEILSEAQIKLLPLTKDVLHHWWGENHFKQSDVFDYDIKYAGVSSADKKQSVVSFLEEKGVDAFIFMSPENVSWLLNKRAKTVTEYPVVFERGILDKSGNYQSLNTFDFNQLKGKKVAMDLTQTPVAIYEKLRSVAQIENMTDPINEWKAVKNKTEIKNIREACLSESKTVCRFLAWVEQNKENADELMCDEKLIALRREDALYIGDSFETIAAVGGHAARAHYRANTESNTPLKAAPLLLVDTGGHYLNGTTDMTRTIAVGTPTPLMKKRYTQVLQGHIDLADSTLLLGNTTAELDKKAHYWLRADGVDYYHGTSHGIGMVLAVHEMPPVVHEKDTMGMKANMVFSDEPAFYSAAEAFGIRIETMLLSVAKDLKTLCFENLLLIPMDYRLVDFDLLTSRQKAWLKAYHIRIETEVFPLLSKIEQEILQPFIEAFKGII